MRAEAPSREEPDVLPELVPFNPRHHLETGRPTTYGTELDRSWISANGIHGGYVAGTAGRAVETALAPEGRTLRGFSARFVSPGAPGPAEIEVVVERSGRTLTTAGVRLSQDGRLVLVGHATASGTLGEGPDAPRWSDLARPVPAVPPPDSERIEPPEHLRHFDHAELRQGPTPAPFAGASEAHLGSWLRPPSPMPLDAGWLLVVCDFLPPALITRGTSLAVAPTVDYQVQFTGTTPPTAVAPDTWLYVECRSQLAAAGFAAQDTVVWAADGTVIALSRQNQLAAR